jgi:hypothetical protein
VIRPPVSAHNQSDGQQLRSVEDRVTRTDQLAQRKAIQMAHTAAPFCAYC